MNFNLILTYQLLIDTQDLCTTPDSINRLSHLSRNNLPHVFFILRHKLPQHRILNN